MRPLHHCPVHATCAGAGQALQDGGGSRLSDHAREGPHRPLTRRHLVVAGVLALGDMGLWRSAAAVATAVEALRQAMVGQEKTSLEVLYAEQLRYGHADGWVEHTAQCITGVMTCKALLTSLTLSERTTAVVGTAAVVRHTWASASATDGKTISTTTGVLQVWQQHDGTWQWLARQCVRPPQAP